MDYSMTFLPKNMMSAKAPIRYLNKTYNKVMLKVMGTSLASGFWMTSCSLKRCPSFQWELSSAVVQNLLSFRICVKITCCRCSLSGFVGLKITLTNFW